MSRYTLLMTIILTLALGLRVTAAFVVDTKVRVEGRQFLIEGDANGYWELGSRIAKGEEYSIYTPPRKVLRTPGFPLLLAFCILVFGENIFAATLVMALVGTMCCGLTGLLARRLTNDSTSIWATAIVSVSPLQIGSQIQILSETWFSFWLLVNLLVFASVIGLAGSGNSQGGRHRSILLSAFFSGVTAGITALVRPGWILWPGFSSLLTMLFARQAPKVRVLCCVLIFAGCWVALFPWAARNHHVTGHWIFTSLWSGPSLYDGLHEGATGSSDMTFVDAESVYLTMSEYDANEHYKRRAIRFAFENPLRTAQLGFIKASRYLSPTLNAAGFSGGPFSLFCLFYYILFWIFFAMGCYSFRAKLAVLSLLAMPFLQFLLVHMVFVGSIRYRLPVELPLTIVAAHGLAGWLSRVDRVSTTSE